MSHEFRTGDSGVLISLGISDEEVERVTMGNHWSGVRIDQWWRVNKEDGFIWNIVQVLRAYCYQKPKPDLRDQEEHARVLVSHLLAADKNRKSTTIGGLTPLQLRNVESYIENHFRDRPLVEDLAAAAGLKKDHFSHLFTESTGFTPHQFIIALRLEYVRRLKSRGTMTNAQIAAEAGFYDESHLINTIKNFRRKYPKNYHGILLPITDFSNSNDANSGTVEP